MAISNGTYRPINIALAAAAALLCVWAVALWGTSTALSKPTESRGKKALVNEKKSLPASSYYNVIVEKDLFRPARQKFVVKPKPKPPVAVVIAPAPPPPKPPPRLNLIGTILLDNEERAVIEYAGSGQKSSYYKVGDSIEDFVIKEIHENLVLLERSGEVLKVVMNPSTSAPPQQPHFQQQNVLSPAVVQPPPMPFVPGLMAPPGVPVR